MNQGELIALHELSRRAYDTLIQKVWQRAPLNVPLYASTTIKPLRIMRDRGLLDCVANPNIVPGDPSSEYTDMVVARILNRWTGWRGSDAKWYKAEFQKHLDYHRSHTK